MELNRKVTSIVTVFCVMYGLRTLYLQCISFIIVLNTAATIFPDAWQMQACCAIKL
jgi:hypothetical protein